MSDPLAQSASTPSPRHQKCGVEIAGASSDHYLDSMALWGWITANEWYVVLFALFVIAEPVCFVLELGAAILGSGDR